MKAFPEPFPSPLIEGMPNYLSPFTLHPRTAPQDAARVTSGLWSRTSETKSKSSPRYPRELATLGLGFAEVTR